MSKINFIHVDRDYEARWICVFGREANVTARETLRALDEQRAKVVEEARAAALKKAQEAIRELGELGLRYRLVEDASPTPAGTRRPGHPEHGASSSFDQSLLGS